MLYIYYIIRQAGTHNLHGQSRYHRGLLNREKRTQRGSLAAAPPADAACTGEIKLNTSKQEVKNKKHTYIAIRREPKKSRKMAREVIMWRIYMHAYVLRRFRSVSRLYRIPLTCQLLGKLVTLRRLYASSVYDHNFPSLIDVLIDRLELSHTTYIIIRWCCCCQPFRSLLSTF